MNLPRESVIRQRRGKTDLSELLGLLKPSEMRMEKSGHGAESSSNPFSLTSQTRTTSGSTVKYLVGRGCRRPVSRQLRKIYSPKLIEPLRHVISA